MGAALPEPQIEDEFPEETALFSNVVFTERVGSDIGANLAVMRSLMIEENQFEAAVFIGGMKGIIDEYHLFSERAPNAIILPVASTGGAERVLNKMLGGDPALAENLDYVGLLYERRGSPGAASSSALLWHSWCR